MGRRAKRLLLAAAAPLALLALSEAVLALVAWALARLPPSIPAGSEAGAILCVGDSNTEGYGARSYPDQLRELLAEAGDPRPVHNLGVPALRTHHMIDRLEAALEKGSAGTVLFLGGANDFRPDLGTLPWLRRSPSLLDRARNLLGGLRTYRVLRGAVFRLAGKAEEAERGYFHDRMFAGGVPVGERPPDDPEILYAQFVRLWNLEEGEAAERILDRLLGDLSLGPVMDPTRLPLVRWELAMLRGEVPAPLPADEGGALQRTYAIFTRGYGALAAGRYEEARAAFDSLPQASHPGGYLRLHRAWAALLERDFARADRELGQTLDLLLSLPPHLTVAHALAAAAVAHLLRGPETRLGPWLARYGASFEVVENADFCRHAREWTAAARWIDARKGHEEGAVGAAAAASRFPDGPRSALLRFLAENPAAGFEEIRAAAPLDLPRASYFRMPGACNFLLQLTYPEFERFIGPNLERLADLARRRSFRLIVLTYLDPNVEVVNEHLRRFAREGGFTLVDLRARLGAEIEADGRKRYFLPDRHHPNAAGYAHVARAVFEAIREP